MRALRKFPVTGICKNPGTAMKSPDNKMLYPELFKAFEAVRWTIDADIAWDKFDGAKLSGEQALTIKMNAITQWAALPATEMFLRDNREDSDFCAFMSVWFYEEQKHSLRYRRAAQWHTEPVIKEIYDLISRDEARHGGAYLRYMKKPSAAAGMQQGRHSPRSAC
jgi:hypothetical protein